MLKYLNKYQRGQPGITNRIYPDYIMKEASLKASESEGAIKAIRKGWRGTADNPQN